MKKLNPPMLLMLLLCISIINISCSDDKEDSVNEIENLDLSKMKLNIDFEEVFIFEANSKNNNSFINFIYQKDKEISSNILREVDKNKVVIYDLVINNKNKITFKNFRFKEDDSILSKNGEWTQGDAWNCPNGTTQVGDSCWSEECVAGNISSASVGFSSGDTVTFTLHHGGAFGGVKVCVHN